MNKAIPWNINGVSFDAREAAREAARRQGKSLGEWLHAVIADHASELGVGQESMVGQDRIEAVTSRLERMSAGKAPIDRNAPDVKSETRSGGRNDDAADDADALSSTPVRRRGQRSDNSRARASLIEDTEALLEEAIDAMEHRARRVEHRTDKALASFERMLERSEEKRERENASVSALTRKLTDIEACIETRLTDRDQSPIKGALARLETRLDVIGRRGIADSGAPSPIRQISPKVDVDPHEPMRRLEDKINAVLEAIGKGAPPVTRAPRLPAAAPLPQPLHRRQLGDAIAEIANRQRTLDETGVSGPAMRYGSRRAGRTDDAPSPRDVERSPVAIAAVKNDIAALNAKIDTLHSAIRQNATAKPELDFDGLQDQIAAMTRTLGDVVERGLEDRRADAQARREQMPAFGQIQHEMQQIRDLISASSARPVDLEPIENQIAVLTRTLGDVVRHGLEDRRMGADARPQEAPAFGQIRQEIQQIKDLIAATSAPAVDLEPIENQIAALTDILNQQARRSAPDQEAAALAIRALEQQIRSKAPHETNIASLESLVRDLGAKIEAVQAPGAGAGAIDALQNQIAALAKRFERSELGLASLAGLERSMQDLFTHLEETRGSIEAAAARAARDAVRMAADETTDNSARTSHPEIIALKSMQEEADQRTHSTLEAVHGTLEKVVDRLTAMETEIAEVRAMPKAQHPVDQPRVKAVLDTKERPAKPPVAVEPTPQLDPPFGRANDRIKKQPDLSKGRSYELDEEAGRADFIAAARRAALAAQKDTSFAAIRQPDPVGAGDDARAGLVARSRDYVATHKRPVLLGMAAVFMIVGTMAIVQNIGTGDTIDTAEYAAPAKIVTSMNAPARAPLPRTSGITGTLTPSALPRSAPPMAERIPGSDPIQTGSIPSLPSFAARATVGSAAAQKPPANLLMMADAGNGAAAFELGSRYADGKLLPRDYKLAAKYYTKAADLGLAPAQYRLASLYEKGLGVAQDKVRAKSLYLASAEAGNPRAMHNLAVVLADGDGKPDLEAAATWFRKAAQFGVHDSQYNLAILLARGLGVEQSFVQSYQWFAVAAAQNDADAATKRDDVANKLSASDLAVAKALAAAFRPRTPNPAAVEVSPPPGGWDGAASASPVNSAKSKVSSL